MRVLNRILIDHDRSGLRPQLGGECQRIGLERQQVAVRPDDLVFVFGAGLGFGDEDLPKPVAAHAHGMPTSIPKIEVADHADPLGRRRKDRKAHAFDAVKHHGMGAELVIEVHMRAFAEQVEIEIG